MSLNGSFVDIDCIVICLLVVVVYFVFSARRQWMAVLSLKSSITQYVVCALSSKEINLLAG